MVSENRREQFPLGNILFALSLAAAFGYYAHDVFVDARGVTDWLLIAPAAGIGITALLVNVGAKVIDWYHRRHCLDQDALDSTVGDASVLPAMLFMGLLALYAALIPVIGFDLGSFLFICLALYLQGERRWWVILGFSFVVSAPVVIVFIELLNIRLPTLLI